METENIDLTYGKLPIFTRIMSRIEARYLFVEALAFVIFYFLIYILAKTFVKIPKRQKALSKKDENFYIV